MESMERFLATGMVGKIWIWSGCGQGHRRMGGDYLGRGGAIQTKNIVSSQGLVLLLIRVG